MSTALGFVSVIFCLSILASAKLSSVLETHQRSLSTWHPRDGSSYLWLKSRARAEQGPGPDSDKRDNQAHEHPLLEAPPDRTHHSGATYSTEQRIDWINAIKCYLKPEVTWDGRTHTCWEEKLKEASQLHVHVTDCWRLSNPPSLPALPAELADYPSDFDVALRPASTDITVFSQVYCWGDFRFLRKLPHFMPYDRPVNVLDGGANIGLASILFAQAIRFSGTVLAVEASKRNYDILARNVAPFAPTVRPLHAALVTEEVARTQPTVTLTVDGSEYSSTRRVFRRRPDEAAVTEEAQTRSLSQLADEMPGQHIDFIKLDVEGEETALLRDPGSRAVLCQARCIFAEMHDRFAPGATEAFKAFLREGCSEASRFKVRIKSGEYWLFCQERLFS